MVACRQRFPADSIFGDVLWGDNATRYIIVDEAGISDDEPVAVVVGLVIHADRQVMAAEHAIKEALGSVPPGLRDGFVFHATDIFSKRDYRKLWAQTDRFDLLLRMMSLPRRLGVPICLGWCRKDGSPVNKDLAEKFNITEAEFRHYLSFYYCIAMADRYMRDCADLNEVGTVVAEEPARIRNLLKVIPRVLRENPAFLPPGNLILTASDTQRGYTKQLTDLRVERIRNGVHFVEKTEDPLMQMADACAFGWRRFLSEQEHGEMFIEAMLGQIPILTDFSGPSGGQPFYSASQS